MHTELTIARFNDAGRADALLAFTHEAFRDLPIDPPSSVLKETAADFAARLKTDSCFVVESDGAFIGSVFCTPKGDALYIGRLAVRADWRRRGIANALVEAAKVEARRIGAARMTLGARIARTSNVALFRRHGFEIVRATCHEGFTTPTSYDMELRLSGAPDGSLRPAGAGAEVKLTSGQSFGPLDGPIQPGKGPP